jgi:KDO2-lipid IV(A) lauroyltransferase
MKRGKKRRFSLRKFVEIYLTYYPFRLWLLWVKHLRLESLDFYGEKFGAIALYILRAPRRIALNNLHLALGREKSDEEIERICRESFKNIGKDMIETSRSLDYMKGSFKTLVRLEGKEYLDEALKQGKGVIALSAHLGNFSLMCTRLIDEGYPLSIVVRESKNPKIVKFMTSLRDSIGMESILAKPRMTCVSRCLNALKGNRILFTLIDLHARESEVWVDFFGYLVPTYKGPVVFSLRTGAPIVPMFIIRDSNNLHNIFIHPSFKLDVTGNMEKDIKTNIAKLTKIIEATIREYPEQWWWALRRFRGARDIQTGKSLFPKRS